MKNKELYVLATKLEQKFVWGEKQKHLLELLSYHISAKVFSPINTAFVLGQVGNSIKSSYKKALANGTIQEMLQILRDEAKKCPLKRKEDS